MSFKKILLEGDTVTPSTHATSHEDGGGDEIDVGGLSGELADPQPPKAHLLGVHTEDTLANLNAKISDATLDDSGDPRDPNAHVTTHKASGSDEIDLDELGAPTGPVALNAQKITGLGAGTAEGDAVALDVNLRAPDSTLLEGSTKSQVQDHVPQAHDLDEHGAATLEELNVKVSDASLDDSGDPRDPNAHAADHKDGGGDDLDLDELGAPTGNVNFAQKQATALALDVQETAPGTPVEGQIYHNSVDGHPYVYVPA